MAFQSLFDQVAEEAAQARRFGEHWTAQYSRQFLPDQFRERRIVLPAAFSVRELLPC
jgi:hypothetical protein